MEKQQGETTLLSSLKEINLEKFSFMSFTPQPHLLFIDL